MHVHGHHYFSTGLWLVHSAPARKAGNADSILPAVTQALKKQSACVVLCLLLQSYIHTSKNSNDFDMKYELDAVVDH